MAEKDNRPLDDLAADFKVEDGIPNSEDPFGDFPSDFSTDIQPGELTGQPQSSELTPESEPEPGPAEISPETPLPEPELPETEPSEIPPSEVPLEPELNAAIDGDVPLGEISDLDQEELKSDTLEFEQVKRKIKPPRSRKKVVLALLAVVIVVGGAWAMLGGGIFPSGVDSLPIVRATEGPVKVRPESPGGIDIPNRDKLVYDRLENKPPAATTENLLPKPETPIEPPEPVAETPKPPPPIVARKVVEEKPPVVKKAPPKPKVEVSPSPPPVLPPVILKRPPVAKIVVKPTPGPAPAPKSVDPLAKPVTELPAHVAMGPAAAPTTAVAAPATAPAVAPAAASRPVSAPTLKKPAKRVYRVQLAAVRDEGGAKKEWARLKKKNPRLLSNLTLDVVRADLGSRGIYFRLRAGPIADRASAKKLCQDLAKRKVGCLVIRPGK